MKIEIDHASDFPMPNGRYQPDSDIGCLRSILQTMKPGESFVRDVDNRKPYLAAKQLRMKITTRKLKVGGWRVWRVK